MTYLRNAHVLMNLWYFKHLLLLCLCQNLFDLFKLGLFLPLPLTLLFPLPLPVLFPLLLTVSVSLSLSSSLSYCLSVCLYTMKIIPTGRKRTGVKCEGSKLLGHWGLTKGWALITSYIWQSFGARDQG